MSAENRSGARNSRNLIRQETILSLRSLLSNAQSAWTLTHLLFAVDSAEPIAGEIDFEAALAPCFEEPP